MTNFIRNLAKSVSSEHHRRLRLSSIVSPLLPLSESNLCLSLVYCQFRYLLSSLFLLDRFIRNFGNLLNLISYRSTGYFRSYLLKFFLCIFSVIPMCRFSSLRATACLVCIYPWGYTLYTEGNSFKSLNFDFPFLRGVIVRVLFYNFFFSLNSCKN
jgi:hypothetical protein